MCRRELRQCLLYNANFACKDTQLGSFYISFFPVFLRACCAACSRCMCCRSETRTLIRSPPGYSPRHQSSQMVSRSRSPLFSAPQTLQRFLLSRLFMLKPMGLARGTSRLLRLIPSVPRSAALAAASILAILSASIAASSASGESSIVSRLEILGLRERAEVGVDGIEEEE